MTWENTTKKWITLLYTVKRECFLIFQIVLKISSKMFHLNSTLHMWNFIPKFGDTILVHLWLLTRRLRNNVHSLESFSLVEPTGTRLMRRLKQIHGNMNYVNFYWMELKFKRISIFIPFVVLEANVPFRS